MTVYKVRWLLGDSTVREEYFASQSAAETKIQQVIAALGLLGIKGPLGQPMLLVVEVQS